MVLHFLVSVPLMVLMHDISFHLLREIKFTLSRRIGWKPSSARDRYKFAGANSSTVARLPSERVVESSSRPWKRPTCPEVKLELHLDPSLFLPAGREVSAAYSERPVQPDVHVAAKRREQGVCVCFYLIQILKITLSPFLSSDIYKYMNMHVKLLDTNLLFHITHWILTQDQLQSCFNNTFWAFYVHWMYRTDVHKTNDRRLTSSSRPWSVRKASTSYKNDI